MPPRPAPPNGRGVRLRSRGEPRAQGRGKTRFTARDSRKRADERTAAEGAAERSATPRPQGAARVYGLARRRRRRASGTRSTRPSAVHRRAQALGAPEAQGGGARGNRTRRRPKTKRPRTKHPRTKGARRPDRGSEGRETYQETFAGLMSFGLDTPKEAFPFRRTERRKDKCF
jgi:hypothetical protein